MKRPFMGISKLHNAPRYVRIMKWTYFPLIITLNWRIVLPYQYRFYLPITVEVSTVTVYLTLRVSALIRNKAL
jgi:hypothetical protein